MAPKAPENFTSFYPFFIYLYLELVLRVLGWLEVWLGSQEVVGALPTLLTASLEAQGEVVLVGGGAR